MSTSRFATTLGLVAAFASATAAPASAQSDSEPDATVEVRALVDSAQRHFDLGEYQAAIDGFREAYRRDPRPGLLYNLGQAYRLAGDCVTAALMYRNFMRLAPDSRHRPLAEQQLTAIADCERAQLDAGATAQDEPGEDTTGPAAHADPGEPVPRTPSPRRDRVAAPRRGGGRLRISGIAAAVTGGVALALGGYFSVDAADASRQVSEGYRDGSTWAELEPIDARGRRSEQLGATLMVAGGVAVAAGATLYALGWRAARHATMAPRTGGGEVVVSWQF